MINSSILQKITLALSVIFLAACDRDFSELGSNIIEDDIHHNNLDTIHARVTAFDMPTGAVQSNNLPLNSLGVYNDPAFGTTVAHFVSQVKLASINPPFTENVSIDTVYLYVPYFSRLISSDAEGNATYELDSIYGNTNASMKLNIYENRFFLRDSDPGETFLTGQRYYSNDKNLVEAVLNPDRLNNSTNVAENDEFKISANQVKRTNASGTVLERFAPGIFVHLNKDFFASKITNAPEGKLVNQNVFKEWFRGLYFNIVPNSNDGAMATMNFEFGKITIIYKQDVFDASGNPVSDNGVRRRERKTLVIDMDETTSTSINTINFFENTFSANFLTGTGTSNQLSGDSRLFLKGGNGSLAFVNLNTADIARLKEENIGGKVLVNDASLTFYVDQSQLNGSVEPLRIYLYDVKNKRPLFDYYTDVTSTPSNPKFNKAVHDGVIQRTADGRGYRYRVRLTNHINNIINKDSANFTLGVSVTESINFVGSAALKAPVEVGAEDVSTLPAASVISPLGTVLYGNTADVPEDKRLRLEIYYTKP